ncbi:hypothetical protein OROMI_001783 [Orobanche minor]
MDHSSSSSSKPRIRSYVEFWLENHLEYTDPKLTGPQPQLDPPAAAGPNLLHHLDTPGAADSLVDDTHCAFLGGGESSRPPGLPGLPRCPSWSSSSTKSEYEDDSPRVIRVQTVHNGISASFDLDYDFQTLEGVAWYIRSVFPELNAVDFYISTSVGQSQVVYILSDDALWAVIDMASEHIELNPVIPKRGQPELGYGLCVAPQQPKYD